MSYVSKYYIIEEFTMTDIDLQVALMESGRMNLMHLPPGAISWLWDRPAKQIDAAESLAVAANAHGNPVVDASLLKADQNVLIIKCEGGECFRVYPDGGLSYNEAPMDIGGCSSVLQGMGQSECAMDDNGHRVEEAPVAIMAGVGDDTDWDERSEPELDRQTNYDAPEWRDGDDSYDLDEDAGNDEHMDTEPPESGVATPIGMTNLAGEPTMEESINLNEIGYNPNHDASQDADAGYDYEQGSGAQPYGDPSDEDEPDYEADGFVVDEPRGGYGASLEQKWLGNYDSYDDAIKAIRRAAGGNYFPSLWFVDDHGGTQAITDAMDESYGDAGGPGVSAMGGMGTGTPYVGDMSMDADPEMENLMMSRELGEASIHMFRNADDDLLSDLAEALGLSENFMDAPTAGELARDEHESVSNIKLEVYDESTDSYQDVQLAVKWDVEPQEFDGQYTSYQGGASVDGVELAQPVRVGGKVYNKLDGELATLILQTQNSNHPTLSAYIEDTFAGKIDVPQHRYPDSTR
jgi:hypothetical protein